MVNDVGQIQDEKMTLLEVQCRLQTRLVRVNHPTQGAVFSPGRERA